MATKRTKDHRTEQGKKNDAARAAVHEAAVMSPNALADALSTLAASHASTLAIVLSDAIRSIASHELSARQSMDRLFDEIVAVKRERDELRTGAEQANAMFVAIQREHGAARDAWTDEKKSLEGSCRTMRDQLTAANASRRELSAQVHALTSEKSALVKQIDELRAANSALLASIERVEASHPATDARAVADASMFVSSPDHLIPLAINGRAVPAAVATEARAILAADREQAAAPTRMAWPSFGRPVDAPAAPAAPAPVTMSVPKPAPLAKGRDLAIARKVRQGKFRSMYAHKSSPCACCGERITLHTKIYGSNALGAWICGDCFDAAAA